MREIKLPLDQVGGGGQFGEPNSMYSEAMVGITVKEHYNHDIVETTLLSQHINLVK